MQLVEIAKALSTKAQILLLDEPKSALSDKVPRTGQRVNVLRDGKNIKKLRESAFLSFP